MCCSSVALEAESRSNVVSVFYWIAIDPFAGGGTYNNVPGRGVKHDIYDKKRLHRFENPKIGEIEERSPLK